MLTYCLAFFQNRRVAILEFSLGARFSPPAGALHSYNHHGRHSGGSSLNLGISSSENMEPEGQSVKRLAPLSLGRYHISGEYGFLLPNPLVRLGSSWPARVPGLFAFAFCGYYKGQCKPPAGGKLGIQSCGSWKSSGNCCWGQHKANVPRRSLKYMVVSPD